MVGTKLYRKWSQVAFFLAMYGLLAISGGALAAYAALREPGAGNAAGFMIVFGAGMFVLTLVKSRHPRVSIYEEFLEVAQGRSVECVRYRNVTGISRPDKNRMVVTLREDGAIKNVVIWVKELEPAAVDRLYDFLLSVKGKRK